MGLTHYNSVLTTSDAAVFSPTTDAILTQVNAINGTGSAATLSLSVHRASGQVETLASALSIPANSMEPIVNNVQMALGGVLVRGNADSIHASAGTASAITLLLAE